MSAREPLFPKTSMQRDLDDLRKQSRADAIHDGTSDAQLAQYEAVTQAMKAALADKPTLDIDAQLSDAQRWAIEQLYVAYTGRDPITTNHVSGVDRSGRLNRALAILQPVLAVGLRPDFLHGRPVYAALTERVSSLRVALTRSIISETMPKRRRDDAKAADQDDDGDGGDGGDAGDDGGAGDDSGGAGEATDTGDADRGTSRGAGASLGVADGPDPSDA